MKRRRKLPKKASKKIFTVGAVKVHPKNNLPALPMRGGTRL